MNLWEYYYVCILYAHELFCAIAASSGAAAGGIIYFVSYLPFSFFGSDARYSTVSTKAKFGLSLIPNLAMAIGCKTLGQFESTGAFDLITFSSDVRQNSRTVSSTT